jgi:hypothetical protein
MRAQCLLLAVVVALAAAFPAVTELTDRNFDEHVGKDRHVLVEFYAPVCLGFFLV